MLVVADTSPIHVLVRIGYVDVLPSIFGTIIVPSAVADELRSAKYELVQQFMAETPAWLNVREPRVIEPISTIHSGEEAAISLARELAADVLLIDDHEGRKAALSRGVAVLGTVGVLERAATAGLIDLDLAIERIRQTDFRISETGIEAILLRHRQRPN